MHKHVSKLVWDQSLDAVVGNDIARALAEDVGDGDLTAALIDPARRAKARVIAREAAVVCGRAWFDAAVRAVDASARLDWQVEEGARCEPNQLLVEIEAQSRALLTAERTALNFLQLLSAVATKTAVYVEAVKGTHAAIVDTRKTLPGLRRAQKYAVTVGGGVNHRIGLYDAVLIKENHIAAAGGIAQVLQRVQEVTAGKAVKFVEMEVENLEQLRDALKHGVRMVLLDNMTIPMLQEAVRINQSQPQGERAILEISGGVTLNGLRELAETGVDRISIGTLTKDVKALDLSMRFTAL
jgi:nicotinate-nucleotide pyrophosphorylase (carboxylating)